jgi:hypothetical protein
MKLKLSNYVENRPDRREEAIKQLAQWIFENADALDYPGATIADARLEAERMCDGTWVPPAMREQIEAVNKTLQKRFHQ